MGCTGLGSSFAFFALGASGSVASAGWGRHALSACMADARLLRPTEGQGVSAAVALDSPDAGSVVAIYLVKASTGSALERSSTFGR